MKRLSPAVISTQNELLSGEYAEQTRILIDTEVAGRSTHSLPRTGQLARLRLLFALDTLLREGSVAGAAESLGLKSSAVSRMLAQLRELFGHRLFTRTAQGLSPTPFAEFIRPRLRALVAESDHLIRLRPASVQPEILQQTSIVIGSFLPEEAIAQAATAGNTRLTMYLKTMEGSFRGGRTLHMDEAEETMAIILRGEASEVQVGAFLAGVHHRSFSAAELAGFVQSMRLHIDVNPLNESVPDLDWPCYVAYGPKSQPWFLHAARLVVDAGFSVVLHGHHQGGYNARRLEGALAVAGVPQCQSTHQAICQLRKYSIVYLPSAAISPAVGRLHDAAQLLEMSGVTRAMGSLLNPLAASSSILGMSLSSTREISRDAATLLGVRSLSVIGCKSGETAINPHLATPLHRLVDGVEENARLPTKGKVAKVTRPSALTSLEYWNAVWTGAARDDVAESIIIDTAAVALLTISNESSKAFGDAQERAAALWRKRRTPCRHAG